MFAYCGNNPVMGYDPEGTWNWGGVIAGLGIMATAACAAVFTPICASPVGIEAVGATLATGAIMAYAAAKDSAMVVDVSGSLPIGPEVYGKAGGSVIFDFGEDGGIYGYTHYGGGYGKNVGVSYSVGLVDNFREPEDYSEWFIDVNAGNIVGGDHCYSPGKNYRETTKATTISFGSGISFGVGIDYYSQPHTIVKWRTQTK